MIFLPRTSLPMKMPQPIVTAIQIIPIEKTLLIEAPLPIEASLPTEWALLIGVVL